MAKDAAEAWHKCFDNWPPDVERRGVLVTSFGDQIVFDGFAVSSDMVLLERRTPDTVGARMVLIAFGMIQALKITDIVKAKAFEPMGFVIPPPRR